MNRVAAMIVALALMVIAIFQVVNWQEAQEQQQRNRQRRVADCRWRALKKYVTVAHTAGNPAANRTLDACEDLQ
jgi:uncharacterized protein YoxC